MDERGKKLFSNLTVAFQKDPFIDEYDFLPIKKPQQNKNPIFIEEHKLAIEAWAVPLIYVYSYQNVIKWRTGCQNDKDCDHVINLTRASLLMNAECALMWNIRKGFLQKGQLSLDEEFKFTALVLTKQPKSPETFSHRRWLLTIEFEKQEVTKESGEGGEKTSGICEKTYSDAQGNSVVVERCKQTSSDTLPSKMKSQKLTENEWERIHREMTVCKYAAEKYPNNYGAWTHRIYTVQLLGKFSEEILTTELSSTRPWVESHVSDYSGFHFRQFLIQKLFQHLPVKDWEDIITKEINFVSGLITFYSGHEALWNHKRSMILLLRKKSSPSYEGEDSELTDMGLIAKRSKVVEEDLLLNKEKAFCQEICATSTDEWQRTLAERCKKWLSRLDEL